MSTRISPHAEPRYSRSLEYGVAILECFTAEQPVLRNSEIASMVKLSRASTNRYLSTLAELEYLKQDNKRRYLLARGSARSGMVLVNTVRRESPARAILEELRDKTGHTASMCLLDGARVLYVYRLHSHRAGQYEADGDYASGAHVPAHSTAIGKALLANLIESEFRSLLPGVPLEEAKRDRTQGEALLTDEVELVRRDGIALGDEHSPRARSIAAPVMRRLDKPILAIQLTTTVDSYTLDDLFARFGESVKHAAKLLSV
jgi:IclR family transcriptional regulator, pca regulon regulatory protein